MIQFMAGSVLALVLVQLWHEMGHLAVARLVHIPVVRIAIGFGPTLWRCQLARETELVLRAIPMGMAIGVPGRRTAEGHLRRPILHDLSMAAGGPLASFVLGGGLLASALYLAPDSFAYSWCLTTALLSVIVAVLNLAPIPGLDGGHLLLLTSALFGWQMPPQREMSIHRVGIRVLIMLLTVVPAFYSVWQWFIV